MKRLVVYVHGKGGCAEEAEHYRPLFDGCDVIGFDYRAKNPWEAKTEFSDFSGSKKKTYDSVYLIANSIGAFFSMSALSEENVEKAWFISPIVNMEKLIREMMERANVHEDELCEYREIDTGFGEILSWEYLCYVRDHPIEWHVPTCILYGDRDSLTSLQTVAAFAEKVGASLTVMNGGEHWFHTEEQMAFLDRWIKETE